MTKIVLQLMGLKCWKCHNEIGALTIPMDQAHTPETLGAYLVSHKILPVCSSCIEANPFTMSYENLKDKR